MVCGISRKILKIKWPDMRHDDITTMCHIPNFTLLVTHGVHGYAAFHVGVHLFDGKIVEFSINHGMKNTNLLNFMDRCVRDNSKCKDPETGPKIRVYSINNDYSPSKKELSTFLFPDMKSIDSRTKWAFVNMKKEDYQLSTLNCEHVARWILCGKAYCIQVKYVKIPNKIINRCTDRTFVLLLIASCVGILTIIILKIQNMRHQLFRGSRLVLASI